MINVFIDEFTPCLKDTKTGELVQTEVLCIGRKSFLKKYNEKNGWYINWDELLGDNEVYALVVEGSVDIQGLVALHKDENAHAVYVTWMCSSPENNPKINSDVKFKGVGGHLFAIAAQKSIEWGYDGMLYGFAANTPKPIPFNEIKGTVDYRGLLAYAKSQGKKVSDLTQKEKMKFYSA